MIHRHPHVFVDNASSPSAAPSVEEWEKLKRSETGSKSVQESLDDVSPAVPALIYAAKIFKKLAENNITVDMIIQSYARAFNHTNDIAFTINREDKNKTMDILNAIKEEVGAKEIHLDENTAKLSIVGAGMMDRPGVAAQMFETLSDLDVNIKMISTSEIKISCLIDG